MTINNSDKKCLEATRRLTNLTVNKEVTQTQVQEILKEVFGEDLTVLEELKKKKNHSPVENMLISCLNWFERPEGNVEDAQRYISPNKISMPTPKPVEVMFGGTKNLEEGVEVIVSSPDSDELHTVKTQVLLDITDLNDSSTLWLSKKLSQYDRAVFNGICTLVNAGYTSFTAKQIYHAMGGRGNPRGTVLESVQNAITRMRLTLVSIDWTEHALMNGLDTQSVETIKTRDPLISCKEVQLKVNGQTVYGYKLHENPVLYDYAKNVKQICTVNAKLLQAPVKMTSELISITQFLLRWVNYNSKKFPEHSKEISYNFILKKSGIDPDSLERRKKNRLKEKINVVLEYWKAQTFIADYIIDNVKETVIFYFRKS